MSVDGEGAAMGPEYEGRRVLDGAGRGVQPLALFCVLTGLLALLLSVGYAVAPSLSHPPGYLPLSGGIPGATAGARAGSAPAGCTSLRCAGVGGGAETAPLSGGGSPVLPPSGGPSAPSPTVAPRLTPTPRASVAGAPAAVSATVAVATVRVTLAIVGGAQPVSVPAALADSPLLPAVVEAYLRCWNGRAMAYAAADPVGLTAVLAEPALGEATARIARLRAEGRAQRFEGGHMLTVVAIEGDRAWLVDEYTVGVVTAPGTAPAPTPLTTTSPASGPLRTPTIVPDVTEHVRVTFTMKRVAGVWKIADSVSGPVR